MTRQFEKLCDAALELSVEERSWMAEQLLDSVSPSSRGWENLSSWVRAAAPSGWPYSIVYQPVFGTIYIVAVAHHRRKPDYWLKRIRR